MPAVSGARRRPAAVWLGIAVTIGVAAVFVVYAMHLATQASSELGDDVGSFQPFAGPASALASAYGARHKAPTSRSER
jgi:uncharacterized membrane protein YedE/YeeE